jgi:hypothetical protein
VWLEQDKPGCGFLVGHWFLDKFRDAGSFVSTRVRWLVVRTISRLWISFSLAGVMTETAGSTASCS